MDHKINSYKEFLFDNVSEAIVLTDIYGAILHFNNEFTTLFGYKKEEAYEKQLNNLIVPGMLFNKHMSITKTGQDISVETIRHSKDNKLIDVSLSVIPILFKEEIKAIGFFFQDISKIKKIEIELKDFRKDAEKCINKTTRELEKSNIKLREKSEEREELEKKLIASENKFKRLFEQSNDVIIIHKDSKIIDANQRASEPRL